MKKLSALLAALAMVFSLCACDDIEHGTPIAQDVLAGDWYMSADMLDMIPITADTAAIAELLAAAEDLDMRVDKVKVTFTTDGKLILDTDDYIAAHVNVLQNLAQWIAVGDNVYVLAAKTEGLSVEEAKKQSMANGQTKADLIQGISDFVNISTIGLAEDREGVKQVLATRRYTLDEDALSLYDSTDKEASLVEYLYTYENDTVTITYRKQDDQWQPIENGSFVFTKK